MSHMYLQSIWSVASVTKFFILINLTLKPHVANATMSDSKMQIYENESLRPDNSHSPIWCPVVLRCYFQSVCGGWG